MREGKGREGSKWWAGGEDGPQTVTGGYLRVINLFLFA